jgi:hypothetical protein
VTYASGSDAELREAAPDTNYDVGLNSFTTPHDFLGTNYASFSIDGEDGGGEVQAVLRFGEIFGVAAHQIPAGSVITSATLTLYEINEGNAFEVRASLVEWDATTTTWNSFGSGSDGASNVSDASSAFVLVPDGAPQGDKVPEALSIDITPFVADWSSGALSNFGLVLRTDLDSTVGLPVTNGVDFLGNEHPDISLRPELEVTFVPEPAALALLLGAAAALAALYRRRH